MKDEEVCLKLDALIAKVDKLDHVVEEMDAIKRSFSTLWQLIIGLGAAVSMLYGAWQVIKDHLK